MPRKRVSRSKLKKRRVFIRELDDLKQKGHIIDWKFNKKKKK